jgi:hypothetical protein
MKWRNTAFLVTTSALLASLPGAGACARHPPPATPGPAPSEKAIESPSQNMGALYFDPQGADFTLWVNRFKDEVYKNWVVPQGPVPVFRGHVDFQFTVEKNGSMVALRLMNSCGSSVHDKAAQEALSASHFMTLPPDYEPARVTMQVSFLYNEAQR